MSETPCSIRSSARQSCGSSMMPTATHPVFATRTAALQPTTTLSATGAGMLFAFTTVQVRLLPTTTMTLGAESSLSPMLMVRRLQIQTTSPMLTRFAIVDITLTLRLDSTMYPAVITILRSGGLLMQTPYLAKVLFLETTCLPIALIIR